MRLPKKSLACALLMALAALTSGVAAADEWTPNLTLTTADAETDTSPLAVFVQTAQDVVNPAGCPKTGGYTTTNSNITNQTLAIALEAMAIGAPVRIYVSSSQCSEGYPMIVDFQIE